MADPSMTAANPSPFDKDAAYLNQTLRHERMELALDDSVSLQTIGLIIVRAWLAAVIPLVIFGILGAIMLFGAADSGGDISGASLMLSLALFCSGAAFWLVLLLSKVTEPIGEWRVLLTERWQYAESYHRMIAAALYQRAIPLELRHKRVKLNTLGQPVKHTIVLAEGDYQAYVTVFPYGTSLYVGWQMWRRRSGAQLIGRALVDRFTAGNIVTAMLRTDRPRAMREAVHLACREAVYKELTQDRWNLAQQVDLGELVEESALLMPQQPPSPVLPPPAPMQGPRVPAPRPQGSQGPQGPETQGSAGQGAGAGTGMQGSAPQRAVPQGPVDPTSGTFVLPLPGSVPAPAPVPEPEHLADRPPAAAPPETSDGSDAPDASGTPVAPHAPGTPDTPHAPRPAEASAEAPSAQPASSAPPAPPAAPPAAPSTARPIQPDAPLDES